jgi:hypothetical protein
VLIDRSHKNWILFTLAASVVSLGAFVLYRSASLADGGTGPSGGSVPGLIWGFLAFGIIIFCCLLAARKKVRIWRLGRAQNWMKAHIWLGLLTVPLVLCHSGMKIGNGLSLAIMILFGIVIVSGVVGLILQNMIPAMLLDRVKAETTFEQIDHVFDVLRDEADEIVAGVCGPLEGITPVAEKHAEPAAPAAKPATPPAAAKPAAAPSPLLDKDVPPAQEAKPDAAPKPDAASAHAPAPAPMVIKMPKPVTVAAVPPEISDKPQRHGAVMVLKNQGALQGKTPRERGKISGPVQGAEPLKALYLKEIRPFLTGSDGRSKLHTTQGASSVIEYARTLLPQSLHEIVDDLASICEERRQLIVQKRLHIWLHGWLFIHAPLSYLLLVLTLIHAVIAPLWY